MKRISEALKDFDGLSFEHILYYDRPVDDTGKKIIILWDGQIQTQEAYRILAELQDQWIAKEDDPHVRAMSCENWMLLGLKRAGLQYIKLYATEEKT